MKKIEKNKGITLIALVITVVVLLILSGVTIATLTGENGILTQAQKAKGEQTIAKEKEVLRLAATSAEIGKLTKENENEYQEIIQDELDKLEGDGNTSVEDGEFYNYIEDWETLKVIFLQTGNIYYLKCQWGENGITNLGVVEEPEELYNQTYAEGMEVITDSTIQKDLNDNYLVNGIKLEINSGDIGFFKIDCNPGSIIDWGDGTYGREKENLIGSNVKVASTNRNILIGLITPTSYTHQYEEKNKIYTIRIYSNKYIIGGSAITKVLDWGDTGINNIEMYCGSDLTQIASPRVNSFKNLTYISFSGCDNLRTIPEDLFVNAPNLTDLIASFAYCSSLTSIPRNLFNNCSGIISFKGTFAYCTALTGEVPELWKKGTNSQSNNYKGSPNGEGCFIGCTNISNYDDIPNYWKQERRPV